MFSSAVKLADLDDFLGPAQDCVKPILDAVKNKDGKDVGGSVGLDQKDLRFSAVPEIQVGTQRPDLIKTKKNKKGEEEDAAKVNLVDCLACSGCVTSAEAVLIEQQSVPDFLKKMGERRLPVISVSLQSRTSLAHFFGFSPSVTMRKLSTLFRRMGAKYVLDMGEAEALALLEAKREFVERYRQKTSSSSSSPGLPLLTSHCPGWILYAEKSVDPEVLPHISRARSSQQIQGHLVKTLLLEAANRVLFLNKWRLQNALPYLPLESSLSSFFAHRFASAKEGGGEGSEKVAEDKGGESEEMNQGAQRAAEAVEVSVETEPSSVPPTSVSSSSSSSSSSASGTGRDLVGGSERGNSPFASSSEPSDSSKYRGGSAPPFSLLDTFHACVMPCFDKKLEASRPEFFMTSAEGTDTGGGGGGDMKVPEVDSVLSSAEILELLELQNVNFSDLPESPVDSLGSLLRDLRLGVGGPSLSSCDSDVWGSAEDVTLAVPSFGGSGGYASFIFREAVKELFPSEAAGGEREMEVKELRNKDFKEAVYESSADGKVLLRVQLAYGFRNVQKIVRQIINSHKSTGVGGGVKGKKTPPSTLPHYVEIMACPGGCLNGGGQIVSSMAAERDAQAQEGGEAEDSTTAGGTSPVAATATSSSSVLSPEETKKRLKELEEILHNSPDTTVIGTKLSENHPRLKGLLTFLEGSAGLASNGDPLRTTFRSLKQEALEKGEVLSSQLKW